MDNKKWEKIESLVDEALTKPEDERRTFILSACKDQPELQKEALDFLGYITASEGWLENSGEYHEAVFTEMSDDLSNISQAESLIGTQLGAYTITEELARGGMGTVYLAKRTDDDFEHQVAVKIINRETTTPENLQRFKQEQNILAKLSHPGIAQLYDGGVTAGGFPYIIMEYINGIPITDYCKKHDYTVHQKIELFKKVLKAIRYAHENLIIHRDLKPDNILIDESGSVKVLDFGISKLLEEDEDGDQLLTKTGSKLLTPRYAAPEQIKQENITTATDLYALGLVLYKLLTGSSPIDFDDLTQYQVEQAILNEDPGKPSQQTKTPNVRKKLKGDLDAIILKAIRKEPESRYRFVNDFLNDLNYYEDGHPVSAQKDSFNYRTKKFFKRHKKGITVAAVFILSLVSVTAYYTYRITEQRNIAREEAKKATLVQNLVLDIFKANDPILAENEDATLQQLLDIGTDKIRDNEITPEIRVELLLMLSNIYTNITEYEKAKNLADESLDISLSNFGPNSVLAARSYMQIGSIEHQLDEFVEAQNHFREARSIFMSSLPEDDPLFAKLYSDLGYADESLTNYDSSRIYFQKSLDIIKSQTAIDSALYIQELRNVARSHYRLEQNAAGDSLLYTALELSKQFHGKNNIVTSSVLNDLGLYNMTHAKYDSARSQFNRSLEIKERVYGDKGHPNYSATLTNLAVLEETFSNFTLAESLYTKALNMDLALFGETHLNVGISKAHLASIAYENSEYEKAKSLREESIQIYEQIYGADHRSLGSQYKGYGQVLSALKNYRKAANYFERADSIVSNNKYSSSRDFSTLYHLKGENHMYLNEYSQATDNFKKAIHNYADLSHPYFNIPSAKCSIMLGESLHKMGRTEEALTILDNLKAKMDTTDILQDHSEVQELYNQAKAEIQ